VLQIEFAVVGAVYGNSGSRVALADPYIESGIADVDAVLPWPDAERMALLEAVLLAARDDLTYGPPTGTHTREMLAKAVASRGRRLRVGWLQPYPLDTGGSNRGTDPPSACPVRRSSVSSWRESGRVGTW
jgi:hypothetical protein